jgi:hypothetical protein
MMAKKMILISALALGATGTSVLPKAFSGAKQRRLQQDNPQVNGLATCTESSMTCPIPAHLTSKKYDTPETSYANSFSVDASLGYTISDSTPYKPTGKIEIVTTKDSTGKYQQTFNYDLEGLDPRCGDGNAGCGFHIHKGTSCADVQGHFWNEATLGSGSANDEWTSTKYKTSTAPKKNFARAFTLFPGYGVTYIPL